MAQDRRDYHREWQRQNKDKVKQYQERYALNRARKLLLKEMEEANQHDGDGTNLHENQGSRS